MGQMQHVLGFGDIALNKRLSVTMDEPKRSSWASEYKQLQDNVKSNLAREELGKDWEPREREGGI